MMSGASLMAGMGWSGVVLLLLLWGAVIALVLWGVSGLFPTGRVDAEADARETLRHRFARGELSRGEFLQASEALRQSEVEPLGHASDQGRRS